MGLDMYLDARLRKYRSDLETDTQGRATLEAAAEAVGLGKPEGEFMIDYISISRQVGYWRKANQIHAWFVKNCQNDVDECREAYVAHEQLVELRDLCGALLKTKNVEEAAELLPPQAGFFFGSQEIGEWYWQDVEYTFDLLTKLLAHPKAMEFDYIYNSSW